MSSKGLGVAGVVGSVSLLIVTVIIAISFLGQMKTNTEAKASAEKTIKEVRETIDVQAATRDSIRQSMQKEALPGYQGR